MDMFTFQQNRVQFPPEKLVEYVGHYVAWSPDGTHILADHSDQVALEKIIQEAGYNPSDIVISFVPNPDESNGGGGSLTS